ncbi:MAG TPA: OsmC family protein [Solirubrobacteraceae bacterium]|jgi:putative redox protein
MALEVTASWRGNWATDVSARSHAVRVDEPDGDDSGMMPTELFCAALASCFCLAVAFAARKRELDVPELAVTVRAERAGTELRYDQLTVETRAALDDETLAKLVQRARPLCWVSNTLAAGVDVEYLYTTLDGRFRK